MQDEGQEAPDTEVHATPYGIDFTVNVVSQAALDYIRETPGLFHSVRSYGIVIYIVKDIIAETYDTRVKREGPLVGQVFTLTDGEEIAWDHWNPGTDMAYKECYMPLREVREREEGDH